MQQICTATAINSNFPSRYPANNHVAVFNTDEYRICVKEEPTRHDESRQTRSRASGQLRSYSGASTAELDIEELEQLLATFLAAVWRHRTAWDRTALVSELISMAKEFVREVLAEDNEMNF